MLLNVCCEENCTKLRTGLSPRCEECRVARRKETVRECAKRYRKANPDKVRSCVRRSYHKHGERRREDMRRRHQKNPDKAVERARRWKKENPDRKREIQREANRRRSELLGGNKHRRYWPDLFLRDGPVCGICGGFLNPVTDDFHVDHIRPVSKGGGNDLANLQLSHPSCNVSKGAVWHME